MTRPVFDNFNVSALGGTTATSLTFALTVDAAQSNRYLVAAVQQTTNDTLRGVTYAALSMSLLAATSVSSNFSLRIYGLADPTGGANTFTISKDAAAVDIVYGAAAFYNCDNTLPIEIISGTASAASVAVLSGSVDVGGLLVAFVSNNAPAEANLQVVDGTQVWTAIVGGAQRRNKLFYLTPTATPADTTFSLTALNAVYHRISLHGTPDSVSVSATPSLSTPTGTVLPTHLLFTKPSMSAERRWWLDELRRRYEARLHADMALAPDFEAEIEAALAALMPTELPAPIAPDTPVGALDTAVAALELAALQDARARAERRTRLATQHAALARLTSQIDALNARIATLETQADDDRVLLFVLPYTTL